MMNGELNSSFVVAHMWNKLRSNLRTFDHLLFGFLTGGINSSVLNPDLPNQFFPEILHSAISQIQYRIHIKGAV